MEVSSLEARLLCQLQLTLLSCICDTKFMSCPSYRTSEENVYKHVGNSFAPPSQLPLPNMELSLEEGLKQTSLGDASVHPLEC